MSFRDKSSAGGGQSSHTLTASDEHSKRQWLTTLQKTIDAWAAKKKLEEKRMRQEEVDSGGRGRNSGTPSGKLMRGASRVALFQVGKFSDNE